MSSKRLKIQAIPEPWSYNPSGWAQRIKIAIFAVPALLISIYLGLYQWGLIDDVWDPLFGHQSKAVLDSQVSQTMRRWFIIPDAILGAIAYLGDILFALAGSERRWQYRPWLVMLFGFDVIPLSLIGALLVFMQAVVVENWCFLCIITAIISLILVFLAYDEVISCILYLYRFWKKTKSWPKLWRVFWGYPSLEAIEVGEEMVKGVDHVG